MHAINHDAKIPRLSWTALAAGIGVAVSVNGSSVATAAEGSLVAVNQVAGLAVSGKPIQTGDLKSYLVEAVESAATHQRPRMCTAIFQRVPSMLDGKPVEKLTTLDMATGSFARNQKCWSPADLTPISACQYDGSPDKQIWTARLGVTLISPRHVLMAKHANLGLGEVIFISSHDREVRRKVIEVEPVVTEAREEEGTPVYADFCVGLLDHAIDKTKDEVDFARILPIDYIPSVRSGVLSPFIPVLHTNQDREVRALDWVLAGRPRAKDDLFFAAPGELDLSALYKMPRGGDSGSPVFTAIHGQLVVLAVFHTSNQGSSLVPLRNEINAVMAHLQKQSGDHVLYQLQEADCTGFVLHSAIHLTANER